jgi:riboflavin biosynthesis pyrimidine reductase
VIGRVGRVRQLFPTAVDDVDLLDAYRVESDGRHVRVNFVSSIDGAVTAEGVSGGLSGSADKRLFGALRTLADVVLVGAGTARAEGYGPARPTAERRQWRLAHGYAAIPPIAVVSGRADLDAATPFFTEAVARPLVYTSSRAAPQQVARLRDVAEVVVSPGETVPVADVLTDLEARGLRRVLCEGGPHLFGDAIAAGCVDELALTLSPVLAGGGPARIAAGPPPATAYRMELRHVLTEDGFLFLRYGSAT